MSLRDAEDLLAARGIVVGYETIRACVAEFGPQYVKVIRPHHYAISSAYYKQARADAHWTWDDITRELKAA